MHCYFYFQIFKFPDNFVIIIYTGIFKYFENLKLNIYIIFKVKIVIDFNEF